MVHAIWDAHPDIQQALEKVKAILISELRVQLPEIETKILDYINAPGKYLRSGLCLMFTKLQYNTIPQQKLYIAAAIEALHLATLIHDDVIDHADTRRGIVAMHQETTNRIAIYAGDYLMTYAARLASKAYEPIHGSPIDYWIMESILVGELNQLTNQFKIDMSLYDYLRQIRGKTALLFAGSTFAGYYDSQHAARSHKQAFYVGQAIGMAFQLMDDLIDYRMELQQSGKPQFQDVQNGIYTAPLILAMNDKGSHVRKLLQPKGTLWTENQLQTLQQQLVEHRAYERTQELVEAYLTKATQRLEKMTKSPYKSEIIKLMTNLFG